MTDGKLKDSTTICFGIKNHNEAWNFVSNCQSEFESMFEHLSDRATMYLFSINSHPVMWVGVKGIL